MSDTSRVVRSLLLLSLVLTAGVHAQESALPDTAVDSLPAEQRSPIKHTIGYGITNGGIGYRHTFSGQQLRPYLSAGAFTISLGLATRSKTNHRCERPEFGLISPCFS